MKLNSHTVSEAPPQIKLAWGVLARIIVILVLITFSLALIVWGYAAIKTNLNLSQRFSEHLWYAPGSLALAFSTLTVGSIIIKKQALKNKSFQTAIRTFIKGNIFLFLRKYHLIFGWAAFTLALGHSLYFLINLPQKMIYSYTGSVAILSFLFLVFMGYSLQHRSLEPRKARLYHLSFTIIFAIALLIHLI